MNSVEIFTDGACKGNPGPGGWAALLRYGGTEQEISGAEQDTTNNRMELTAAIRALAALKCKCQVRVTTDSEYVKNGITVWLPQWKRRDWKTADRKPVKNLDLWQQLEALTHAHEISWHWVRGHSGHAENDRVDQLAVAAVEKLLADRCGE